MDEANPVLDAAVAEARRVFNAATAEPMLAYDLAMDEAGRVYSVATAEARLILDAAVTKANIEHGKG